ncbi:hypothetical protein PS903_01543 [Pseudomonas fluorescens]|nr:hypothetical protein PS903_01543 [Pseudomonas fluorescens]
METKMSVINRYGSTLGNEPPLDLVVVNHPEASERRHQVEVDDDLRGLRPGHQLETKGEKRLLCHQQRPSGIKRKSN